MSNQHARQNRSEFELNRENRDPPLDRFPTAASPGSDEKIEVMSERYDGDVQLHHPLDLKYGMDRFAQREDPERDRYQQEFDDGD
jgi:hypothetical protein